VTESRKAYALFSEGRIAGMKLPNRFVRSATADSLMHRTLRVSDEDVAVYRNLARGGVGLIVTGGFHVTPPRFAREEGLAEWDVNYDEVRIQGINRLVDSVRTENPNCRIVAQLQTGGVRGRPSSIPSPFSKKVPRELGVREIRVLIDAFAESIRRMKEEGFDGAQLHAGHGTVLCRFFSLYTNRRTDAYGGSTEKRLRIAREIVEHAREVVGDFPILIKANGTDYVESGTDLASFPDVARELERIGFDAIEITGGMWECLARSQE
jgi:2,4-dienoyl-CoA reductase-like NADH-dependent reductase (Old Yellow Enzyme family)